MHKLDVTPISVSTPVVGVVRSHPLTTALLACGCEENNALEPKLCCHLPRSHSVHGVPVLELFNTDGKPDQETCLSPGWEQACNMYGARKDDARFCIR